MKYITVLLLFIATNSAAQRNFSVHAEAHLTDTLRLGLGGGFRYTFTIADKVSIGGGVSALKFEGLKAMYFPVVGHIAFHPVSLGPVTPLAFIEAGTGIYSHTETIAYSSNSGVKIDSKGGLTFFVGLGARFNLPLRPTLYVGRSRFDVHRTDSYTNVGGNKVYTQEGQAEGWGARLSVSF